MQLATYIRNQKGTPKRDSAPSNISHRTEDVPGRKAVTSVGIYYGCSLFSLPLPLSLSLSPCIWHIKSTVTRKWQERLALSPSLFLVFLFVSILVEYTTLLYSKIIVFLEITGRILATIQRFYFNANRHRLIPRLSF